MTKRLFVIIGFIFMAEMLCAQYFDKLNAWKRFRHEVTVGVGVGNYLGELGGGNGPSRPWLLDMEFSMFRACYNASYRYNTSYRTAVRASGFYGKIMGDDKLSGDDTRKYRNLSFESKIIEGALLFDFFILRAKPGHIHNIKGAVGQRGLPIEVIAFAGAGVFYFNPKADGVALRPLRTEGQGLPGGGKTYAPISFSVPYGFQVNYTFRTWLKFGLDMTYRYTITDYIDDASTLYYDNDELLANYGATSAAYADRTDGSNPTWSSAGSPRGNPKNNDHYFNFSFIATYNFGNLSKRAKRPGGRHTFNKKGRKARF